jgi:basic membrane protein A and related proteins
MKKILTVFPLLLLATAIFFSALDSGAQDLKAMKVSLVFDLSGRGDGGFNDSAYNGLEKAVKDLGVKAAYMEPKRKLDQEIALNEAVASDADMIIGVGFAFAERLDKLAAQYPDKRFLCVDYSVRYDDKGQVVPLPENLLGLMFRDEEGSYLVGAIAALTSRTGKIGFIGGMDSPAIRRFQAGYLAGAKAVRPDISVSSGFAGITGHAFNDPEKGYEIATGMYKGGADIVYHASGATGAGLFRAAREMHKLAIGVDIDQSAQAPGLVLTSMVKNIDVAVFEGVRSMVEGRFTGGLKELGLKEDGVGFSYNDQNMKLITKEIYDRVLALKEKIIAGELAVPVVSRDKAVLSQKDLKKVLSQLSGEISTALNNLGKDLEQGAQRLSGKGLTGDDARDVLKRLYNDNPYLIDCETVSDKGIMLAVEPAEHRTSEGADISAQAHMVRLGKTHKPVLSGSFRSVEGPDAVVIHSPVFTSGRLFAGSVSTLFAPEYLLSGIVGPIASNLPVDIMLMQTDGLIIYDIDTKQIGLNVFNDQLFQPYPELIAVARKMAASDEGTGIYRFTRPGGQEAVTKVAYWQTVSLYDTKWRVMIACEKESIEK